MAVSQGNVKGTIVTEVVKFLRSRREEARRRLPAGLHHYLDRRILATSWHPEEDYIELMRGVVQLLPGTGGASGLAVWEMAARRSAPTYFKGAYKPLVFPGDVRRSLAGYDAFWRLRHDTGKVTVAFEGERLARVELRDYALVSAESCALTQGTLHGLLEFVGARQIQIQHPRCRARAGTHCEWQIAWV